MTIQEARQLAEAYAGQTLDEQTFQEVLEYTRHKAQVAGHDEDYVPLLLYDEVKDLIFRDRVNNFYFAVKVVERELDEMLKRGEWPCAKSASGLPA